MCARRRSVPRAHGNRASDTESIAVGNTDRHADLHALGNASTDRDPLPHTNFHVPSTSDNCAAYAAASTDENTDEYTYRRAYRYAYSDN